MNLIIKEKGSLSVEGGTLCFVGEDGVKERYPIEVVSNVFTFKDISITSSLLRFLKSHCINVYFFDLVHKESMELIHNNTYSGDTLLRQVGAYLDEKERLKIAKSFVDAEIHNLGYSLLGYRYHTSDLSFFSEKRKEARDCPSIPRLMLLEALCLKRYYEHIASLVEKDGFFFNSRHAHRAEDPINQMITYLNAVLYGEVLSLLLEAGLNPVISFNHSSNERTYSLQLDFADVYKPLLVEKTILYLIHMKRIKGEEVGQGQFLDFNVRKMLIEEFHSRLHNVVKIDKRFRSYEDLILDDAYKLRSYLKGKSNKLHFFHCAW